MPVEYYLSMCNTQKGGKTPYCELWLLWQKFDYGIIPDLD